MENERLHVNVSILLFKLYIFAMMLIIMLTASFVSEQLFTAPAYTKAIK